MKKLSLAFCCCFISFLSFGQAIKSTLAIIPEPVKTVTKPGQFTLPKYITIQAKLSKDMMPVTDYLRKKLTTAAGAIVTLKANSFAPATIKLLLTAKKDTTLGREGYKLWVSSKGVVISANEPAGLFYGVQTLMQLLPKEIESAEVHHIRWTVPNVEIIDYPRFAWRGLMFDVSRHFLTKEEVKQYIDQMVRYKFNLLHMHHTDDDGWRIEIKSLPRLTSVGAYKVK